MTYEQLSKELAEHGEMINPEGLQKVYDDEIRLSHTAHKQFEDFMIGARKMFHGD